MRDCCPTELKDAHSSNCDYLSLPTILEISFTEKELHETMERYMQIKTCMAVIKAGYDPQRAYVYRTSVQFDKDITFRVVELPDDNETKH